MQIRNTEKSNNFLQRNLINTLYAFLFPFLLMGQAVSVLSSELSENILGGWVDEENNLALILTKDYIIINDELWYYNEIIKENEVLNITCINNSNVKYISLSLIDSLAVFLDEGFRKTMLEKLASTPTKKIPKAFLGNWFDNKDKIELFTNGVSYKDINYRLDDVFKVNNENYSFVLYHEGEYYLCTTSKGNNGVFLTINFQKKKDFVPESFFKKYALLFVSLIVLFLLAFGYVFFRWKIKVTNNKEIIKRRFMEMELKSIRSQMNPHFIFNALSAIQNLINKGNNEKANHYLTEFSQLMRLTLDKSEKGLVPLSDEIRSIEKYLELEKLRFSFNYTIKLGEDIDLFQTEIPAMLIQPFIENAIIHGLYELDGDKEINVALKMKSESLVCTILDNGIGIEKAKIKERTSLKGERYGLKLAKDRIRLINEHYNTNAKIEITDISKIDEGKTGTLVEIFMPLKY